MTVTIETILLIVLVCIALALIGLVLIQHGKGADAGASFGGGGSQTVFGGAGSGNFLTKSSWILAGIFFVICLALAYIAREKATGGSGIDFTEPQPVVEEVIETDVPQYEDSDAASESDVPVVDEAELAEPQPAVEEVVEDATESAAGVAEEVEAVTEDVVEKAQESVEPAAEAATAE